MAITEKYVSSAGAGAGDGSSQANAQSWANFIVAGLTAGVRVNVLDAITRTTNADTIAGSGTVTSPTVLRFCNTTPGNGYGGRTLGNGPLVTTNMPVLSYTTGSLTFSGTFVIVESANITGAPAGPLVSFSGADSAIRRSRLNYSGTDVAGTALTFPQLRAVIEDNDIMMTGASGGLAAMNVGSSIRVRRNRITGKTAPGINIGTTGLLFIQDNIIYRCTNGITQAVAGAGPSILDNLIVLCSGDGINLIASTTVSQFVSGNRITDNTGFGINANGVAAVMDSFNRFDRNTGGTVSGAADWMTATSYNRDVTSLLQAAEYNNAAADDYRIVSGAPTTGGGSFAQVAASAAGAGGKTLLGA